MLPYARGGFKVPDFQLYYLCGQAQYAHHWYHPTPYLPHMAIEEGDALPIPLTAIVLHKRPPLHVKDINTIDTTNAAWLQMAKLVKKTPIYAPSMPLHDHQALSVTQEKVGMNLLKQAGIDTMGDLYANGSFIELKDLAHVTNPTPLFIFTYYRLQRAIKELYPMYPNEPPPFQTLQSVITEPASGHLVSRLYNKMQEEIGGTNIKALARWNAVLDTPITNEEWMQIGSVTSMLTPNGNLRILHFKYLHQTYYTPARLYQFGLRPDARCKRCGVEEANFIHMAWACAPVHDYWENVMTLIGAMVQVPIDCTIRTCLLGLFPAVRALKRKFCVVATLLAKRRVSIQWGSTSPPTIQQWMVDMAYCKDMLLAYEVDLPIRSRSKDFWKYLIDYVKLHPNV